MRLLRASRLASVLGLEIESGTADLARDHAAQAADPAGERQFAELRGIVAGPEPLRGVALMDELGLTPVVLPELETLRGVVQNPNHHLDVFGHTLAVLEEWLGIESDLPAFAGDLAAETAEFLAEPLADELTRAGRAALRRALPRPGQAGNPLGGIGLRHLHRSRRGRRARSSPGSVGGFAPAVPSASTFRGSRCTTCDSAS